MNYELYQPQAIYEVGQRKNQEDSIYPVKGDARVENRVFVVCDGMGGHEQGEVASAAVCQALSEQVEKLLDSSRPFTDDDLRIALKAAYTSLDQADTERAGRMGTTMTLLCLHRGGCMVAHIGDSRIYHLRPQTGEVLYRSRDHSLVQQLYEMGDISYNEMTTHPRKNLITKAMQPYSEPQQPTVCHITDVQEGDYFYLCSDGMLEQMEDDELLAVLAAETSDEEKTTRLMQLTADNADNHSAYLVHVKHVVHEADDEQWPEDEREARAKNKALNDQRKNEAWNFSNLSEYDGVEEGVADLPPAPVQGTAPVKKSSIKSALVFFLFCTLIFAGVILFMLTRKNSQTAEQQTTDTESVATKGQVTTSSDQIDEAEEETITEVKKKENRDPDQPSPSPEEALRSVINADAETTE